MKQDNEILKSLQNIEKKLDVMIKIQKSMAPKPPTPNEEIILKFCNSKNSINEIAKITKKSNDTVKKMLSNLRKKGIIKSVNLNGKTVFSKV